MMTPQELEAVILEYLQDIYKATYIGKLKVTKKHKGFLIELGLGMSEAPRVTYTELEGDKLLKFIKQDLRDRKLHPSFFGSIALVYPEGYSKCTDNKCYDKRRINR